MNHKLNFFSITLAVIFIIVSYSCQQAADVIYRQNGKLKSKAYYLKKLDKQNIDNEKVYFIDEKSIESKFDFLNNFHANEYYYFYGAVFVSDDILFKTSNGNYFGCKQIIKILQDDQSFPFKKIPNKNEETLKKYKFINSKYQNFEYDKVDKKTVILIYNHSMGNIFFKDIKELILLINSDPSLEFAILVTDFF